MKLAKALISIDLNAATVAIATVNPDQAVSFKRASENSDGIFTDLAMYLTLL